MESAEIREKASATLPWQFWILPLIVFVIGDCVFIATRSLYLNFAFGIIMIMLWGPRVLASNVINLLILQFAFHVSIYPGLCAEPLLVFLAWWLYKVILKENPLLQNLRSVLLFIVFAISVPLVLNSLCYFGVYGAGGLTLHSNLRVTALMFLSEALITIPFCFSLLYLAGPLLVRVGWSRHIPCEHESAPLYKGSKWQMLAEMFLIFMLAELLAIYFDIGAYWQLAGVIFIWCALRMGFGITVLLSLLLVGLGKVLPMVVAGEHYGAHWAGESLRDNAGLLVITIIGLITGRLVNDQARKICELERLDHELKESDNRFRISASCMGQIVFDSNSKTNDVIWEGAIEKVTGFAPDELKYEGWVKQIHPDDAVAVARAYDKAWKNNDQLSATYRFRKKNGDYIWVEESAVIIKNDKAQSRRMIGAIRDITEKNKEEQEVRQVQKMEALGNLAGGIAHDFNNILAIIVGFADMCARDLQENSALKTCVNGIINAAEKARNLSGQILTFSRKAEIEKKPVRITGLVKDIIQFQKSSIPRNIRVTENMKCENEIVLADQTQMQQVVMNLLVNAWHAIRPSPGVIDISVQNVDLNEDDVVLKAGRYVKIVVADNGCGMPAEVMARIFEPYYTTKAKSEGTGLGLAVVQSVIRECKGDVRVDSVVGKGTSFIIYLPVYLA